MSEGIKDNGKIEEKDKLILRLTFQADVKFFIILWLFFYYKGDVTL